MESTTVHNVLKKILTTSLTTVEGKKGFRQEDYDELNSYLSIKKQKKIKKIDSACNANRYIIIIKTKKGSPLKQFSADENVLRVEWRIVFFHE